MNLLLSRAVSTVFLIAIFSYVRAQGGQAGVVGEGREVELEGHGATYQHILTPGDQGEWTVNARQGETIIASAYSQVFDPAIQVVDEKNTVLVENDDVSPGNQNPLVLYRFPTAGTYRILVKGFKSAAGGAYNLSLRRFMPSEAVPGARTAGQVRKSGHQWVRFSAKEGDTMVFGARAAAFQPRVAVFGPDGNLITEGRPLPGGGNRSVFRAGKTGDYYAHIDSSGRGGASYAATLAIARVSTIGLDGRANGQKLPAGGLDIWTFTASAGDIVAVEAGGKGAPVAAELSFLRGEEGKDKPKDLTGEEEAATFYVLAHRKKKEGSLYAVLNRAGTYQVAISQGMDLPSEYSLRVSYTATPLSAKTDGSLDMGAREYWVFDGKQGEIVQLGGNSSQFDLILRLFDQFGRSVTWNDDGSNSSDPQMTVMLPATGRYILEAAALGDGGSGTYGLWRRPYQVRGLGFGGTAEGVLGSGATEIWSFNGMAGQTIVLSCQSSEFDTSIRVVGPDGLEVAANNDGGEGTDSLVSVKLPLNGAYTVWVSGGGSGKYRLKLFDLS